MSRNCVSNCFQNASSTATSRALSANSISMVSGKLTPITGNLRIEHSSKPGVFTEEHHQRKQPQSLVQRNSSQQQHVDAHLASKADKRTALWKEVENLNTDKNALTQELINLRQHQETSQSKLILLWEKFEGVEKNQQQVLSFIVMAMQRPE